MKLTKKWIWVWRRLKDESDDQMWVAVTSDIRIPVELVQNQVDDQVTVPIGLLFEDQIRDDFRIPKTRSKKRLQAG